MMTPDELLQIIDRAAREGFTELNLSDRGLTTLPPEMAQLSHLTGLDLSYNQLTSLPETIAHLSNLTVLSLGSNRLTSLPDAIGQLTHLTTLDLSGNRLTSLPNAIGKLINLTTFNLGDVFGSNKLTSLPDAIGQLTNLTILSLSSNQLKSLPDTIAQLTNLTKLRLNRNHLTSLPNAITHLTNLTVLDLRENHLTSLPDTIAHLTHLTELYLGGNHLTNLPDAIAQLTNLTGLYLGGNQLTSLPDAIASLTNLTTLHLRSNQLTSLPDAIAQLRNLTTLYLNRNKLTSLPTDIRNLTKLEKLDLTANPELSIPPEILGNWGNFGDPTTILNYYFQLRTQPSRPLNEAKVLIVGEGDVGKTSLLRQLLGHSFDPYQNKTPGITIQPWNVEVNQQTVQLNLWDFGGQEIMHATHQFFLSKRSLYLLVIDCRQSEVQNQLEYWLQIIASFGGDSPIILVGNQCDHQPLDIDQRGLSQKYPNLHAILETSCKANRGIDTLKATLIQELSQLPHLHEPLPQTWFTVKEELEKRTQDFLSRHDYEQVCVQADIPDSQSQTDLLHLLHNLGIALNFQDDIRLSPEFADTNVLNPEWVTNGVYKILNNSELFTVHNGILNQFHLLNILDSHRYPRDKHSFLIGIMRKFDLCFDLDGFSNEKFLIPGLLPKEEPYTGEWEGSLTFQYHYNVLPPSIISRFIVRMNSKISKRTYWRSGVVLKERENSALIRADREDKLISIQVKGNLATRRSFLSIIRSQFDEIHRTIPRLGITEYLLYQEDPPILLDCEDLISAEEAGEQTYFIGKLKHRVNLRELLDGVEPIQKRIERRVSDPRNLQDFRNLGIPDRRMAEREVFISYAWDGGESEAIAHTLDQYFQSQRITIIRDIRDLKFKASAREFMEWLGRGKCIITVISDEYLRKRNCMYELVNIAENAGDNEALRDRIFPVVLPSAKIYDVIESMDYVSYWDQKIEALDTKLKQLKSSANLPRAQAELNLYTKIRAIIDTLTATLYDMKTINLDMERGATLEDCLGELLQAVEQKINA